MTRAIGRVLAPFAALGLVVLAMTLLGMSDVLGGRSRPAPAAPASSTLTTIIELGSPGGSVRDPSTTDAGDASVTTGGSTEGADNGAQTGATIEGAPSTGTTAADGGVAEGTMYTVRPGDSPYSIAREFDVSTASLMEVNGILDARSLRPGMVLRIPSD